MKVSLNIIKQYLDFELPPVSELVARINEQLGGVENSIELEPKYRDVVIVKVVSTEKHPNADKLSVCMIDDGGVVEGVERDANGHVQVVCGAPNVRADLFAAWLPPKSTVPATYGTAEPFVLDTRDLRGIKSNGMLAAADELDLGVDHTGIVEIDPDEWKPSESEIKPGASFAKIYGLDDTIIDIENKMFTHRPDCFGQLGVAREIAGILGHKFSSPNWYIDAPEFKSADGLELTVTNQASEKVPRLVAVAIQNVTIKPSPLWLRIELLRLGGKPINNIVDVTNYVMLLTAQPTHAYDYDKLRGHTLGARLAEDGEKTTLLNGKTYELTPDDIVIVDGEGIVGLGGVMGGGNSEVSESTTNIVLECANFDMYTVRKTSMRHGIFTDAVTRFNKGQSPLQNDHVLSLLMMSINNVAGGEQASEVFDVQTNSTKELLNDSLPYVQTIAGEFINERLGSKLTDKEIVDLLNNVEFHCHEMGEQETVCIVPPFWRTDIIDPEDIVEEIGRLYGYDKLPRELPNRSIAPVPENPVFVLKQQVRDALSSAGANEVLTYSFVHENLMTKAGQDPTKAYRLGNALSPDLQYYRLSLTPSLLDKVHMNVKAGHSEFALFEIGKAHRVGELDAQGLPREFSRLALVYAKSTKGDGAAYYTAKAYLLYLLRKLDLDIAGVTFVPLVAEESDFTNTYYEPRRAAKVCFGNLFIGSVGEYKASTARALKLPDYVAGFEIEIDALMTARRRRGYKPLSRYPSTSRDISLETPNEITYDAIYRAVTHASDAAADNIDVVLQPVSIYQAADNPTRKTTTFHFEFMSYDRTLTDGDIAPIMDAVANDAKTLLGATRI